MFDPNSFSQTYYSYDYQEKTFSSPNKISFYGEKLGRTYSFEADANLNTKEILYVPYKSYSSPVTLDLQIFQILENGTFLLYKNQILNLPQESSSNTGSGRSQIPRGSSCQTSLP